MASEIYRIGCINLSELLTAKCATRIKLIAPKVVQINLCFEGKLRQDHRTYNQTLLISFTVPRCALVQHYALNLVL